MEELYEELPGDQEEELYEDLPDSAYIGQDYPSGYPSSPQGDGAPPPLPTSAIPQYRPAGPQQQQQQQQPPPPPPPCAPPPSIPTRSPTTTLSNKQGNIPQLKKVNKDAKKKPPPSKPAPVGLDMNEILKKARARSERNFEDLEKKNKVEDSEDKHAAPWANQLKRTPKHKVIDNELRSSNIEEEEEVPEFIRKRRTMSITDGSDSNKNPSPTGRKPGSPVTRKPAPQPPVAKPRVPNPNESKPPKPVPAGKPALANKPVIAGKPPIQIKSSLAGQTPKPRTVVADENSNGPSVPPKVSQRPVPVPRSPLHSPNHLPNGNGVSEMIDSDEFPPPPPIREKASTLERKKVASPNGLPPEPLPSRAVPPKPMPRSSSSQNMQPSVLENESPPIIGAKPAAGPPPIPVRVSSDSKPPPPPPDTPPPPSSPPPPLIPVKPPLATHGQPTPPTGSVMKFRRLPLQPVNPLQPPNIPSRALKPPVPQMNGMAEPDMIPCIGEDEEDIYDDTMELSGVPVPIEEDLYDDLAGAIPNEMMMPFPNHPSPLPSEPSEAPPPVPTLPPPNKRPPLTADNHQANGIVVTGIEEEETYEDVSYSNPTANITPSPSSSSFGPPTPTISSLATPSPQHAGGGSTTPSPTLGRKQKLTKDDKKKMKELEKQEKEKQRQEKELEKEAKRKNEIKMKNKIKGLKAHKQFELPNDVKPLFPVEVVLEYPKATKDHLTCYAGDILFVLLIAHEKMSPDKYLVEKEDGTIGFVKKNITQRTNYQSAMNPSSILSQPPPSIPTSDDYPDEDLYESLPQDENDLSAPPLPSMPHPNVGGQGGFRFPAPLMPPPPPPPDEETYESLPEDSS